MTDKYVLLYLHDWSPPIEGQVHKWVPGKNVFPECHAYYETWEDAEAIRNSMSNPDRYWVVKARKEDPKRQREALIKFIQKRLKKDD